MLNLVPHFLHLPFCSQKLKIGISSVGDNVFQQLSHFERPKKIDLIPFLTQFLLINTHQNEPNIVHKTNSMMMFKIVIFYVRVNFYVVMICFIVVKSINLVETGCVKSRIVIDYILRLKL